MTESIYHQKGEQTRQIVDRLLVRLFQLFMFPLEIPIDVFLFLFFPRSYISVSNIYTAKLDIVNGGL